ncbi:hypothetical protein CRG98_032860 [Punica granatum]|uniref:Uncharacterized protein n=1 Tax=Punica granatum TaxID=22663 RepID=A0A2I0ISV6_PUNGR|nr:hypothetical protein CRG98_032860 [Punica granatum]
MYDRRSSCPMSNEVTPLLLQKIFLGGSLTEKCGLQRVPSLVRGLGGKDGKLGFEITISSISADPSLMPLRLTSPLLLLLCQLLTASPAGPLRLSPPYPTASCQKNALLTEFLNTNFVAAIPTRTRVSGRLFRLNLTKEQPSF